MPAVMTYPVALSDAAELIAANQASREHHAPWAYPFTDAQGFDAWFGRMLTGPSRGFVARGSRDGAIIGVVNITEIVWGAFRSAYLGYYGMAGRSGGGLMTTAVDQVVQYAFDQLGLHRLEANIQSENTRSIALVRRLGFEKEGFSPHYLKIDGGWRDHERWARTSTERSGFRPVASHTDAHLSWRAATGFGRERTVRSGERQCHKRTSAGPLFGPLGSILNGPESEQLGLLVRFKRRGSARSSNW